jgi:hypothetical protein
MNLNEQIWCEVVVGVEKILIGCVYRPPNQSNHLNLIVNESIKSAKRLVDESKYTGLLVAGDFYYPSILWL